jgi:hypothetical protein
MSAKAHEQEGNDQCQAKGNGHGRGRLGHQPDGFRSQENKYCHRAEPKPLIEEDIAEGYQQNGDDYYRAK